MGNVAENTLLEERGIKVLDNEAEEDASLDVDSILAEVENAEANSDELGLGVDEEEEAEENPADLKAAMDELLMAIRLPAAALPGVAAARPH